MAVGPGDQVMVPCRVSANPPIVSFQWFFNSSDNKVGLSLRMFEQAMFKTMKHNWCLADLVYETVINFSFRSLLICHPISLSATRLSAFSSLISIQRGTMGQCIVWPPTALEHNTLLAMFSLSGKVSLLRIPFSMLSNEMHWPTWFWWISNTQYTIHHIPGGNILLC